MPRQSRGPSRPTAAPARAPAPQQTRPASTAAHPQQRPAAPPAQAPTQQQQAPAASGGSGLFGQMASTAAGVAVGSSIGHAIGGFFGGGSSAPAAPVESTMQDQSQGQYQTQYSAQQQGTGACATDVGNFRKCMDENQGSLTICGWYLDQLKACQEAAGRY